MTMPSSMLSPATLSLLRSWGVQFTVPVAVGGIGMLVGFWHLSATPLIVAFTGYAWFIHLGLQFHYYHPLSRYWATMPLFAIAIVVAQCVFIPFPFNYYYVVNRGNGDVNYGRWFVTTIMPFDTDVRHFDSSMSNLRTQTALCQATTSDGYVIQSNVGAELYLPFDGLEKAYRAAGSKSELKSMVKSELCVQFAKAVSRYAIESFPSRLTIEVRTAEGKRGMNALGVLYNGTVQISDTSAFARQKR